MLDGHYDYCFYPLFLIFFLLFIHSLADYKDLRGDRRLSGCMWMTSNTAQDTERSEPQHVIEEEGLPTPPLLEVEIEEYDRMVADSLENENEDYALSHNGNGNGTGTGPDPEAEEKEKPISWSQLPKKTQLLILVLARLSEPLTQTSLQAYLFYQLKSFDPSLPDSAISRQAGIFQGSFTAAQFLTSVWWGRAADSHWVGRKRVLLVGLFGTLISCVGFGFSRSFTAAIIFRILGGLMNSNVGVMRTMISEIIVEKKYITVFVLIGT